MKTKSVNANKPTRPIETKNGFDLDDLLYALENAAEFLETEQWPEPETKPYQEAANREGAKRIRRMCRRLNNKR